MSLPSPGDDRTCIVTGASAGIGAEIARELARRGLGVTLVARREERLRTLAEELAAEHGVRAEVVGADLTDAVARHSLAEEVAGRGLTVDVLVNNAGIGTFGPVHKSPSDHDLNMLRTNVEALAHMCSLYLPGMAERRSGAVLNVASTAAFQPMPGQAGYGASKAFVLSYSQAIRAETKSRGLTITTLCPGPVETEFSRAAGLDDEMIDNALPRFMWVPAEKVARAGVEGLARGHSVVIPGAPNRATAFFGRHLPPRPVAWLVARRHPIMRS